MLRRRRIGRLAQFLGDRDQRLGVVLGVPQIKPAIRRERIALDRICCGPMRVTSARRDVVSSSAFYDDRGVRPFFHPAMNRVPVAFGSLGLGDATGEPSTLGSDPVPLHHGNAALCIRNGRQIGERTMWADVVVIVLP
jgi:hypothetical protein